MRCHLGYELAFGVQPDLNSAPVQVTVPNRPR